MSFSKLKEMIQGSDLVMDTKWLTEELGLIQQAGAYAEQIMKEGMPREGGRGV